MKFCETTNSSVRTMKNYFEKVSNEVGLLIRWIYSKKSYLDRMWGSKVIMF